MSPSLMLPVLYTFYPCPSKSSSLQLVSNIGLNSNQPLPPQLGRGGAAILSNEVIKILVLPHGKVVAPVHEDIFVHTERGRRARWVRRPLFGVDKRQAIAALGVEVTLAAAGAGERCAPGTLGGNLPLAAVGAGSRLQHLVGRASVNRG